MTDDDVRQRPCEECGGECKVLWVGYSCPLNFAMQCSKCNREFSRSGVGGIRVVTPEEGVRLRPHFYLDHDDPEVRDMARRLVAEREAESKK
jgi:hypothetical protein